MAYEDDESIGALQQRLRRLEVTVDAAGLGLWEWDVRGGALTWNARNYELFGVPVQQSVSIERFPELIYPEDRDVVRDGYLAAAERPDGGDFMFEYRTAAAPDGRARWILTRGRVIKDADGARLVVGSNFDISDRKTA